MDFQKKQRRREGAKHKEVMADNFPNFRRHLNIQLTKLICNPIILIQNDVNQLIYTVS